MKILFLTQGSTVRLFHNLEKAFRESGGLSSASYYVTDSEHYADFLAENPSFEQGRSVVKEWELLQKALTVEPNWERLSAWESSWAESTFWKSVVADRRLWLGKRGTFHQDLESRYSHAQLASMTEQTASALLNLFDQEKPDMVVGFICVTIGEHIAYLISKDRGVPFFNLRPTRIRNFFYAGESIHEPSDLLGERYRAFKEASSASTSLAIAKEVLKSMRAGHAMYEGVLPANRREKGVKLSEVKKKPSRTRSKSARLLKKIAAYSRGTLRTDNHFRGFLYPLYFRRVLKPMRELLLETLFSKAFVKEEDLEKMDFAFYPLHKEPEVTLLVYSTPYLNQLEVIRSLARNLPMGMKLLVKEHPAGIGYHPMSFYRDILRIKNVRLIRTSVSSRKIVMASRLVAIVSGSIGLEALVQKKPVIALGNTPFSWLPKEMIVSNRDPFRLAEEIRSLLRNHHHSDVALENFFAATIESSVPIDFYSVLIGRGGVVMTSSGSDLEATKLEHTDRLRDYLLKEYRERYGSR